MKKYFALSLLVFAGLLLAACGTTTPVTVTSQPVQRTISVNGEGIVKVVPDIAVASMGVESRNTDVTSAVNDNIAKTNAVIAAIKAQGVQDADIQTSNFSVYFQDMSGINNNPIGTGQYVVDNTVTVTIHDIAKLGAILGDALAAGANSVSGVSFTLEDPTAATQQARSLALKDAQTRAGELAAGLGIKVGNVFSVSESTSTSPSPMLVKAASVGYGGGGAVPVSAGLYEVDVTVSVVFEIQ